LGRRNEDRVPLAQSSASAPIAGAGDLLQLLRDGQARTKAELAAMTGLARSTVASRLETLLSSGWVAPAGEAASSGGRPPAQIVFNPLARCLVAVDLGATHGVVAVTDLVGTVLAHRRGEVSISDGPEAVLDWVVKTAHALLGDLGRQANHVAGVGIGVPGPVEHATGRPNRPPIMPGWDQFDIPAFVHQHFEVPVLVDNDVNLLALGERATMWPRVHDLVYVKVSTGIGMGIISGGHLQRGAQGAAGDIGHVQVPYSRDSPREATDESDLEAIASGSAVAAHLASLTETAVASRDVVDLVRQGNSDAIAAVRQAGRELGQVLAIVVNLLNPSIIVIGGSLAEAGEHLLAGVREVVYRRSIPLATQNLAILQSHGGETAGVIGAGIMASQEVLSPEAVETALSAFSACSPSLDGESSGRQGSDLSNAVI
jgi:glucokinase